MMMITKNNNNKKKNMIVEQQQCNKINKWTVVIVPFSKSLNPFGMKCVAVSQLCSTNK